MLVDKGEERSARQREYKRQQRAKKGVSSEARSRVVDLDAGESPAGALALAHGHAGGRSRRRQRGARVEEGAARAGQDGVRTGQGGAGQSGDVHDTAGQGGDSVMA
eukprot:2710406-Rhodomonas_salina.1